MDKITRYLILLFFFVTFLGLAPVIVLYVSGTNFNQDGSSSTGILDFQSDPSNAKVFLNGKETATTPSTVRFLPQGIYDIEVNKDGYWPWQKRLFVKSNQVTYSGANNDLIKLLPKSDPLALSPDKVLSMVLINDKIVFSDTKNQLQSTQYDKPDSTELLTILKSPVSKLSPSNKTGHIFIEYQSGQKDLYSIEDKKFITLPQNFKAADQIWITRDNVVFARIGSQLWQSNLNDVTGNLLLSKVLSINVIENNLYVARQTPEPLLAVYIWNGKFLDSEQILINSQPDSNQTVEWPETKDFELLITARKEIFVLANEKLYRINQTTELLAEQVKWYQFNSVRGELIFRTPTTVAFYNFISSDIATLHSSSENISTAIIRPELGYGFIVADQGVTAIETDTRNKQNSYSLFSQGSISTLQISNNDQQLVILDTESQKLYSIVVKK